MCVGVLLLLPLKKQGSQLNEKLDRAQKQGWGGLESCIENKNDHHRERRVFDQVLCAFPDEPHPEATAYVMESMVQLTSRIIPMPNRTRSIKK